LSLDGVAAFDALDRVLASPGRGSRNEETAMSVLWFSIIGSADRDRNDQQRPDAYKPPVSVDESSAMAKSLGAELAKRGHGLVVYDAAFIEADVVEGYVSATQNATPAVAPIIIRQPQDGKFAPFKEEATHPALFERRADKTGLWEVSFFRSLADSDGLILVGGAYSTSVAGQVAIGARIPILALERSGGSARTVWKTIAPGIDLPSIAEHAHMARDASPAMVASWIDGLEAQRRRRYAVESGPILWHAAYASLLFVLAMVAALASHLVPAEVATFSDPLRKASFFASTLLAGAAGASIRMVFERRYGSGSLVPPAIGITLALGMMAGALAGLLYFVAQPGALDLKGDGGLRLVSIVVVVSTVAGLTVEAIFRKLLGIDVLQTRSIAAGGDGTVGKP
jgi:hypothetical protein